MFSIKSKIFKLLNNQAPNTFLVMHGNIECCVFTINNNFTEILKYELFNRKHTPIEIKDSKSLFKWINKRLIPANRIQYDRIVSNYLNVYDNLTKLILDSYGLSLSDGYWIKQYDDRVLIKRGKTDVYNEVIVSKILDEFGFNHTEYWFNRKP